MGAALQGPVPAGGHPLQRATSLCGRVVIILVYLWDSETETVWAAAGC